MVDVLSKKQRSYNMSRIQGRDTKPELMFRRYLFSKGLRGYRVHSKLPGKPDIVFTKYKLAIFVDGCFWHRCPKCFKEPETNKEFWRKKITGNIKRDKVINRLLKKEGWVVLRFWEHLFKQKKLNIAYIRVLKEIKRCGC